MNNNEIVVYQPDKSFTKLEGNRKVKRKLYLYNHDVIISVEYRMKNLNEEYNYG